MKQNLFCWKMFKDLFTQCTSRTSKSEVGEKMKRRTHDGSDRAEIANCE